MKHFILMADVIKSGEREQDQLMSDFKKVVQEINQDYSSVLLSPLTITLGDEFQGVIKDLASAVKIILSLEEKKIHNKLDFQLRYVLHQGLIDTPINENIAYEMLGAGLTAARLKLNSLKKEKSRFIVSLDDALQTTILNEAFVIFAGITEKWNLKSDYELVASFIALEDYKRVAENLNKTRSQVWKREKTLNIESYKAVKKIIQLITEK